MTQPHITLNAPLVGRRTDTIPLADAMICEYCRIVYDRSMPECPQCASRAHADELTEWLSYTGFNLKGGDGQCGE